jgi:hypothetical protein
VELILVVLAVLSPIILNVYVWRRLRHGAGETAAPWRRSIAYFGLATNFLAYAIPWTGFIYMYLLLHQRRVVSADEMIDGRVVVEISVGLAALSLVLGVLGPKSVRVQLVISAVIVGAFWLSIPMGVL